MEQLPDFIQVQIDKMEEKKEKKPVKQEYPQLPDFIEAQRDERVDDLKKELNSELVHTDHFTLNLDN